MATLRELDNRLKSVRNIEKITKSMKMIASTKLAKAQRAMAQAKAFGVANNELAKHTFGEEAGKSAEKERRLFIVISSDKGLCGGIHSSVSKATRRVLRGEPLSNDPNAKDAAQPSPATSDSPIMVIGDKSKAQLTRAVPKNLVLTFNQIGRDIPTLADATAVADLVLQSKVEGGYSSIVLVYNRFVSSISYEPAWMEVRGEKGLEESTGFNAYEMEDDATRDIAEFTLANAIYSALVEGHACEMSSRRNAMENASNNAQDMIGNLQLKYNRGRQAVITNELIDIITGASAL